MQNGAFHARHEFDDAVVANVLDQLVDNRVTQFAVGHLASTETQTGLHLVAVHKEANGLILFGLVVVFIHGNGELDLFDHDDFLLFAGGALALFFLVKVAAVILDAADRRHRVG